MAWGRNVTVTAQLAPAIKLLPQLFVSLNDVAFAPVIAMPEMVNVAVPVFWMAITRAALFDPTAVVGNETEDVENEMAGTRAVIAKLTFGDVPPPGAGLVTVMAPVPTVVR
jgi:hypothetical protein